MAAIDGILRIVVEQGGDQLVLSTDAVPLALAGDRKLRLTMPATSQGSLRALLGEFVRSAASTSSGALSTVYDAGELGAFLIEVQGGLGDGERAHAKLSVRSSVPRTSTGDSSRSAPMVAPPVNERWESSDPNPDRRTVGTATPPSLEEVLQRAVSRGASDVHASDGHAPSFRVDGLLVASDVGPVDVGSWLTSNQLEQVRSGRSIDLAVDVSGQRFRANFYVSLQGLSAAIRALKAEVPSISALGLPRQVEALPSLPHGLVIVCGYTGSGKTTTLAALTTASLSQGSKLCISLEDPIEYRIRDGGRGSLVRQREVGTHVRDFPTGLRDALREDPDTLLIGEMRDPETIALALTAAETGHLVMSSLHSRTTASAIDRIVDAFGPEQQRQVRLQLSESLRAVVAQRLLPRAHGTGRVVAVEVLRVTRAVAHWIREGRTEQIASALHSGKEAGMLALERHLAELVRAGSISLEAARASTHNLDVLEQFLSASRS